MFKYLIYTFSLFVSAYCHGEFTVLHHPSSILFKGHDHIKESLLPEVYSASIGFSTEQDSNWQGMYLLNPFNLAKAVVTVAVDGVASVDLPKGHKFALRTDTDETEVFTELERRVEERYPEGNNQLIRVDLANGLEGISTFQEFQGIKNIKIKKAKRNYLKTSVEEDRNFLEELSLLNAVANQIKAGAVKPGNSPSVFWFKMSSLHALSDLHGENSTTTKEAKQLLGDAIVTINEVFNEAYDGRVIVSIISSDASHTRRVRSVGNSARADTDFSNLNLAKVYSANYPVIFNIILWFGVAMVFTLLAISIFIASMDPGRDSIIYRMTSTRMKKDN